MIRLKSLLEAVATDVDVVKFKRLADAQRGDPEAAMVRIQQAQISQLYGWACEHVGDLTNRIAQAAELPEWAFGAVDEKVHKTLRALTHAYGFQKEVNDQIRSNVEYYKDKFPSVDDAKERLRQLGKAYADAHQRLPVFNTMQKYAQRAATSLGEFQFATTVQYLQALKVWTDKGRDAWVAEALK